MLELDRHAPSAGARLVALAEALAEALASRAAVHDREASFPHASVDALKRAGYFTAPIPAELGGLGVDVRPRPRRRLEPPGPRRRVGRDRRQHAPGRPC